MARSDTRQAQLFASHVQLALDDASAPVAEPEVRYRRSAYGWRASINLPGTRGSLHVNERHLWDACQGVRAKYAAWLQVSQTFGWR